MGNMPQLEYVVKALRFSLHVYISTCVGVGGGAILKMHIIEVVIKLDNVWKGSCRRYILSSCGGQFSIQFKPV